MIDLTPLEVRQKKGDFRRSMRGYDAELVNDFLDLVADRMEELVKENMALKESHATLDAEVTQYREKERALSDALMVAQRLRDDARGHAEKESELMIREARLAAEAAREEAIRALGREQEALREARARRAQMIDSFRRLLERELGELDVIEKALELQGEGVGHVAADTSEPTAKRPARSGKAARPANAAGPGAGEATVAEAGDGGTEGAESAKGAAKQEDWLSSLVEE